MAEPSDRFVCSATEADLAAGGEHVRVRPGKEFVVRLQSYGVELGPDDPWFKVVSSRRLLDLANTYVGMWSKLEYVDVWYSVPQPEAAERISSQRWHRDYNDKHLLKVFLYLVDVDERMGPFQFVAGSQPGGPYEDAWGWQPLGRELPDRAGARVPHPRLGRADLHRPGGHAPLLQHRRLPPRRVLDDEDPRVLATATYFIACLARGSDGAELHVRGRGRRARSACTVCAELSASPKRGSGGMVGERSARPRSSLNPQGTASDEQAVWRGHTNRSLAVWLEPGAADQIATKRAHEHSCAHRKSRRAHLEGVEPRVQ